MIHATNEVIPGPGSAPKDMLTEVLRMGAQEMLAGAIQDEVSAYINAHVDELDDEGKRLVARNGHKKQRSIDAGIGTIDVRQPRVNDRRVDEDGKRFRFTSKILPPYLRRTKSIDELIPWLYLKGISTGDFSECLQHLVGVDTAGLSPTTVVRLKETWFKEQQEWNRRSLEDKNYVYIWADGIHFNIRLEEDRQCILVVLGATVDGKKDLLAIAERIGLLSGNSNPSRSNRHPPNAHTPPPIKAKLHTLNADFGALTTLHTYTDRCAHSQRASLGSTSLSQHTSTPREPKLPLHHPRRYPRWTLPRQVQMPLYA